MATSIDFSYILGQYVKQVGYSLGQLAKLSGVPKKTIANWLEGRVKRPRKWQDIARLAAALRLSADEANKLLQSAGHQPLNEALAVARASEDSALVALLEEISQRRGGEQKADRTHFGELLNQYVTRNKQTPGQLSKLTGIPKNTIINWLTGKVKKPHSWPDIAKLASALHLSGQEASRLLRAAGHQSIEELLTMFEVLSPWAQEFPKAPMQQGITSVKPEPTIVPSRSSQANRTSFTSRRPVPKLPDEFQKQVREACKHYDKPERIGKLPLASIALQALLLQEPDHATDEVGRGNALKQLIEIKVGELKPLERHTREGEIYLCLYCYVYQQDPYTGRAIEQVSAYLESHYQIHKATYNYRLKKEAIPQLSYLLSAYLVQQTIWIEPIPQTRDFVGREKELADYDELLKSGQLAVIQGLAGIGKTALGARLAEKIKKQRPVCWLTIRRGLNDSSRGVLYAWAVFLAQHEYPQLWAFMRATASEEKALEEFFPLLRQALAQVQPLLCLDNLEILPEKEEAFWSLLEMVHEHSDTSLLLISQPSPPRPRRGNYSPLSGLSRPEIQQFMKRREIDLTAEQAETVRKYTLGNPRLLTLWTAYVRQKAFDIRASLNKLRDSDATASFLATEVLRLLTTGQQEVLRLLTLSRLPLDGFLLQNPPKELAPRLAQINPNDFSALQQLGLIYEKQTNQWEVSQLLKDYLLAELRPTDASPTDEAIALHQWLADLYILQGNVLEAAYHAIEADEAKSAILWLAEQQHSLIEQGYASAMSKSLSRIQAEDLSVPIRRILRTLRAELWQLSGDYAAAEGEMRWAADEATRDEATTDKATTKSAQAHAERALGEIARGGGNIKQADAHYQKALQLLAIQDATVESWLRNDRTRVLMEQNELNEAFHEAQRAKMVLENILGNIARRRGDFNQALFHFKKAAQMAKRNEERRQLARINNSLAGVYRQIAELNSSSQSDISPEHDSLEDNNESFEHNLRDAIAIYKENLQIVKDIGEKVGEAITLMNMGNCYAELGNYKGAIEHITTALSVFKELPDAKGRILAHLNLAEHYLHLKQVDQAREHAEAALQIDPASAPSEYPEAQRVYAEVLLAQEELTPALRAAEEALDKLRQAGATTDAPEAFSDPFYTKLASETLARIHSARGDRANAKKYQSLANKLRKKLQQ